MELKNIIHHYLGCSIQRGGLHPEIYLVVGVRKTTSHADGYTVFVLDADNQEDAFPLDEHIKLILRHLSSMTEEEKYDIVTDITYKHVKFSTRESALLTFEPERYTKKHNNQFFPDEFTYLIKQHFDLFGLIESGQAIDSTKL